MEEAEGWLVCRRLCEEVEEEQEEVPWRQRSGSGGSSFPPLSEHD